MSFFKNKQRRDVHAVFLNRAIFADLHHINGRWMPAIIDYGENAEREKRYADHIDGMYRAMFVLYVAESDYGRLPSYDSSVRLDGKLFSVLEAKEEDGVFAITLAANRGRGR